MTSTPQPPELNVKLEPLVARLCNGTIDRAECGRLDALLKDSEEARSFYLLYTATHARLHRQFRGDSAGIEQLVGDRESEEREHKTEVRGQKTQDREQKTGDGGQENELSAISSGPVGHAPHDENDPTDSAREACPTPRSKSWLDRASRRPVRPALAIAALVMISVVAWMGVTTVKTRLAGGGKSTDEHQEPTKPEFVAWLMKAHETQWLHGTQPERTRLMPGQRLAIAKGVIEIQYRTRAVVVIEGPAEFFVGARDSGLGAKKKKAQTSAPSPQPLDPKSFANAGYLAHGRLVARVEGKKAQGFTVETPSGRVEDHGTEFGVEVLGSGAAEFVVLSGEVDVIREASGGRQEQRIRLTKEQGAFVTAKGGAITRRAKVDVALVAAMRRRLEEALPTQTSTANVIRFDFNVKQNIRVTPTETQSTTNAGWTAVDQTGGTDGTVNFTVTAVGTGVALGVRDRGTNATSTQGIDNSDIQVPEGRYGDMYRDIIYADANATGEGMDFSFIGLATNATYDVAVWSYDSVNSGSYATWGPTGGSTATSSFVGDSAGAGADPNTNALTDYSTSFQITTDSFGAVTIEGRFVSGINVPTINGIELKLVSPVSGKPDRE